MIVSSSLVKTDLIRSRDKGSSTSIKFWDCILFEVRVPGESQLTDNGDTDVATFLETVYNGDLDGYTSKLKWVIK